MKPPPEGKPARPDFLPKERVLYHLKQYLMSEGLVEDRLVDGELKRCWISHPVVESMNKFYKERGLKRIPKNTIQQLLTRTDRLWVSFDLADRIICAIGMPLVWHTDPELNDWYMNKLDLRTSQEKREDKKKATEAKRRDWKGRRIARRAMQIELNDEDKMLLSRIEEMLSDGQHVTVIKRTLHIGTERYYRIIDSAAA